MGQILRSKAAIHVADIREEPVHADKVRIATIELAGARTLLGVPILKDGEVIGIFGIYRQEVRPFSAQQIELVQNFASQAVIAIENTRLLNELRESLQQQTATADVLKVISRSALDLQKVLDALVESAARLCNANDAAVFQLFGKELRLVAHQGQIPMAGAVGQHALPLVRGRFSGRVVLDRQTIQVADMQAEGDEYPESQKIAVRLGYRTALGVPLVHAGEAIGVIFVRRMAVRPFTARQIELVETFADQAVIAIENARLFEAEQASKHDLQESLEQQTAIGEILRVISRSPTDIQPVLDAVAERAAHMCEAYVADIIVSDGETINVGASFGELGRPVGETLPLDRTTVMGRSIVDRCPVHVGDLQASDEFPLGQQLARRFGHRTILAVPLVRKDRALGTILVRRSEVRPFAEKHIALLKTFADQAAIAIENTRLFQEVQARNRDLTALGEVGRAVSSTLDLKAVLKTIVDRAVELSSTDAGSIFYFRQEIGRFELGETTGLDADIVATFRKLDIAAGQTGLGEAIANGRPLQVADITKRPSNVLRDAAIEAGLRAVLIVPLLSGDGPLGALVLQRRQPGEFSPSVVALMQSFADQSAIALENARLFDEIAQKSRELDVASQHKSQFVANMSHELRTPLAAILGYAELMQEGFYEPLGPKSLDALTRIRANGKHLLGLINTVLDIAKIESGQFKLNLGEYTLENVVETVRAATESLAETKKLGFKTDVAQRLPIGVGDEQRLIQVLLNLVGNAIKFTDRGEVRISATALNSHFSVRVSDTGPGIPVDEQKRIFEQFHQVDGSDTKPKGGTGLGLTIAKQIVEMHGGRIWVESTPGEGATFQMELPIRAANQVSGA